MVCISFNHHPSTKNSSINLKKFLNFKVKKTGNHNSYANYPYGPYLHPCVGIHILIRIHIRIFVSKKKKCSSIWRNGIRIRVLKTYPHSYLQRFQFPYWKLYPYLPEYEFYIFESAIFHRFRCRYLPIICIHLHPLSGIILRYVSFIICEMRVLRSGDLFCILKLSPPK